MEADLAAPERCGACRHESVDKLTGLADRWWWEAHGPRLLQDAQRTGASPTLLLIDLDGFKGINDSWGHRAGDAALAGAADVVRGAVGSGGLVGRYGGDEFLVLLPYGGEDEAVQIADQVCEGLRSLAMTVTTTSGDRGLLTGVTASVGVAVSVSSAEEITLRQMVLSADSALQQAKRYGRDQVRVANTGCAGQADDLGIRPVPRTETGEPSPTVLDRDACLQHLLNFCHVMSGHWNPDVLLALSTGPRRYNDLLATIRNATAIDGWSGRDRHIQASILNRTLRRLERDGLVHRSEEPGVWPRSVHYELTEAAHALLSAVVPGVLWSRQHEDVISQAQRRAATSAG